MRIAIDAIKRLKQRDVAVQISMGCIKKDKSRIFRRCGRRANPRTAFAWPNYYLEGKCGQQQLYCQELQGVDAVEAPAEVAVRCIVSDIIYPVAKNKQPRHRVRWK